MAKCIQRPKEDSFPNDLVGGLFELLRGGWSATDWNRKKNKEDDTQRLINAMFLM